jgi:universal stress protein E
MQAIRSILVVMEPGHPANLALNRARLLASVTRSQLHLLVCDKKGDHAGLLNQAAAGLQQDGYEVTTQQAWHDSPHQTIIKVQKAVGANLIVKQHFPDNPLKKALLTPDDWKLLRYSSSPVLMVKTDRPWTGGIVLAAVDVGNKDGEHRTLHAGIVSHGAEIAALAKGSLHVLSAHPSPMLSAADPTFQISESIKAAYLEKCREFQLANDIPDERLHVEEGPADVLIPHLAHKLNAVVTIIGTVARTGFSGALIGNTAEVVLDTLESDVLVVKPDDILESLQQAQTQP